MLLKEKLRGSVRTKTKKNDVFDALPFMPVVSQGEAACPAQLDVPTDGILTNNSDSSLCLASHVREVMHYL